MAEWVIDAEDQASVVAQVETRVVGDAIHLTASVRALRDVSLRVGLRLQTGHAFGVGVFGGAVVQRSHGTLGWAASATPLTWFYTMDPKLGSVVVTPVEPAVAICSWHPRRGAAVTVVIAGLRQPERADGFVEGEPDWSALAGREMLLEGDSRSVLLSVRTSSSPAPSIRPDAVSLPNDLDALTHSLALWGSQVPSLGTLEIPGSAYPTVNLPRREYGTLHTFFDPDAWSVVAGLSFAGIDELYAEGRAIIERSLGRVAADGLVPHHIDGEGAIFVAISGSPQPGPNLFIIEAAIDHACARGDFAWLASAWRRGLRAACVWLLEQVDPQTGLLDVEGALWVDVFRRGGLTLDTNAMAIRTFSRAAEVAQLVEDDLVEALRSAAESARQGLQLLWSEDHFVTSRDRATGAVFDRFDAENYLAIAVGAASEEQARRILALFDGHPLTHPGGRGTWVSLRRSSSTC